jgi:hypothetical protein
MHGTSVNIYFLFFRKKLKTDNKGQKKIADPKKPGDSSNSPPPEVAEPMEISDPTDSQTLRQDNIHREQEKEGGGEEEHSNIAPTSDVEEDLNSNQDEQTSADRSGSPAKFQPLDGMSIIN